MPNMEAIGTSLWRKYDTDDFNTHIFHSDEYIHKLAQDSGFEVHSIYHWGPPILFNAGYWFKEQSLLRPIINFFIQHDYLKIDFDKSTVLDSPYKNISSNNYSHLLIYWKLNDKQKY